MSATSRSLSRRLQVLLGAVAAVLVLILVVGGLAVRGLVTAQHHLIDEIQRARVSAKDLEVALLDQETALRGYAIASDDDFLAPYVEGVSGEQAAEDAIEGALADDEEVVSALDAVRRTAHEWRVEVAEPARELIAAGDVATAATLLEGDGKALYDEVRAALAGLDGILLDRREAAVADTDRALVQLVAVGAAGSLLLVAMGAVVAVALRRTILAPLEELGADAKAVADGDFSRRVRPQGPAEVQELAGDIETMRLRITDELQEVARSQVELATKADELHRSNRDLEQFAYVASHDLQEPLRKVAGFCQLLERRYAAQLDERAQEYVFYAVDGAQRMQDLISDLLSFSRVGRTTERFELVDLAAVVEAARREVDVPEGGRVEVEGPLPTVAGDRTLLRTLFVNLVSNSIKFSEGPPVVTVTAAREGDRWAVAVQDDGIGIDPEFGERIFDIFQRLHTRDVYEGTGIGLALCKRIAEFHGGGIRLAPSERGACFVIDLPVVADPDTVGPPPEPLIPSRPKGSA